MPTTKWRYCVRTGALTQDALNEIGEDGWELAAVTTPAGEPTFYFKRPQPSLKETITLDQRARYAERGASPDADA